MGVGGKLQNSIFVFKNTPQSQNPNILAQSEQPQSNKPHETSKIDPIETQGKYHFQNINVINNLNIYEAKPLPPQNPRNISNSKKAAFKMASSMTSKSKLKK
jgi:hypothetical protein